MKRKVLGMTVGQGMRKEIVRISFFVIFIIIILSFNIRSENIQDRIAWYGEEDQFIISELEQKGYHVERIEKIDPLTLKLFDVLIVYLKTITSEDANYIAQFVNDGGVLLGIESSIKSLDKNIESINARFQFDHTGVLQTSKIETYTSSANLNEMMGYAKSGGDLQTKLLEIESSFGQNWRNIKFLSNYLQNHIHIAQGPLLTIVWFRSNDSIFLKFNDNKLGFFTKESFLKGIEMPQLYGLASEQHQKKTAIYFENYELFTNAKTELNNRDYGKAKDNLTKAKEGFLSINENDIAMQCDDLISTSNIGISAITIFEEAKTAFNAKDYQKAKDLFTQAKEKFSQLDDTEKVSQCEDYIKQSEENMKKTGIEALVVVFGILISLGYLRKKKSKSRKEEVI